MSDATRELASSLEDHGTSRADFRDISDDERHAIARQLVIARAQAQSPEQEVWKEEQYRWHMRRKKELYYYECGAAGLDRKEAEQIWWSVVYDNPAPYKRDSLI
jgi:hypothetical protein